MCRDIALLAEVRRVPSENHEVYGADKTWRQTNREAINVARCTVERLMRALGISGVVRGKAIRTTRPDPARPCPLDRVQRKFTADSPDPLWVSDCTFVSTWQGFAYVAFIIDVYARIVGWKLSANQKTQIVLDALE